MSLEVIKGNDIVKYGSHEEYRGIKDSVNETKWYVLSFDYDPVDNIATTIIEMECNSEKDAKAYTNGRNF